MVRAFTEVLLEKYKRRLVAFHGGIHGRASLLVELDLSEDLVLVKACLLYADQVKLCSVGSSLLYTMAEFEETLEIDQLS